MKTKTKVFEVNIIRGLGLASVISCLSIIGSTSASVLPIGAGSIADQPNPDGYTCVYDYGAWVHNAGVVEPGISGCDAELGPIGTPTPLYPQLTGPAEAKPTATHRWWGSVSFYGEMAVDDASRAGYITPDPITARITNRGFRMSSIPSGMSFKNGIQDTYDVPDPFSEVFDGIAIGNSLFTELDAKLYDYSDGSMTVEWQNNNTAVMRGTFVHGSPYVYMQILQGDLVIRTKAFDGPEKGIFHQGDNQLGVWTSVAGNYGSYLVVGDGSTQFQDIQSNEILVTNQTGYITVALIPGTEAPNEAQIVRFSERALNRVDEVKIDYQINKSSQRVSVTQQYLLNGEPVDTFTGLMPLQWKNSVVAINSEDQVRSARGYIKFTPTHTVEYELPFVGVLPALPTLNRSYDSNVLGQLIRDFVAEGPSQWNPYGDTYWSGKAYGRVSEVAALAQQLGMADEHQMLIDFLKTELEDWFTAQTDGQADTRKYFSYDEHWNTLLGYQESFGSQQQLNDHHFHYGYFVRAAAEICRTDKDWCAPENWGGMVELLIRDYAADRDDPLFPYARNFDPANGFSWASGHANFVLGNNNESTSEAANAYGAIILYGLITGNDDLTEHGVYLHTLSTASYWEYWNNIDRFLGLSAPYDNFSPEYDKLTTSIIWGGGHVFSTWFSGAYAHILGIQGLPMNPLVMHIGLHSDYLKEYVELGLTESENGKPSGLPDGNWRDIWWNIWSMTDPEAAIADFNTFNFDYSEEEGESKPHTYHWIHTLNVLGTIATGTGEITSNWPSAQVYEKDGQLTYVAYNYSDSAQTVQFSDGTAFEVAANSFGIEGYGIPNGTGDTGGGTGSGDGGDNGGNNTCTDICFVEQGQTLVVTVSTGEIVDLHYKVNGGAQQNVRMTTSSGVHEYRIENLVTDDVIDYFFTVIETGAYDTTWDTYLFNTSDAGGGSTDGTYNGTTLLQSTSIVASSALQAPELATDNNEATRWESTFDVASAELTLDFGTTVAMNNSLLYWEAANAANYTISGSIDGSSWTTLYQHTNGSFGDRVDEFQLQGDYRYLKLLAESRSVGNQWGYSVWEWQVFGE